MDSYQIFFPVDMDLRMKCLLIASAVLLVNPYSSTELRISSLAQSFSWFIEILGFGNEIEAELMVYKLYSWDDRWLTVNIYV